MGASSERKAPSMMLAAISAPGPKLFGASWTMRARPVLATEAVSVSRSSGEMVRRSMTSGATPSSAWSVSAASSATRSIAP